MQCRGSSPAAVSRGGSRSMVAWGQLAAEPQWVHGLVLAPWWQSWVLESSCKAPPVVLVWQPTGGWYWV